LSLRIQRLLTTALLSLAIVLGGLLLGHHDFMALGRTASGGAGGVGGPLVWYVLVSLASAGILTCLGIWIAVQRITMPLRRLADNLAQMARMGRLQSDFASAGGSREVRLIEQTFRALLSSLEESQHALERSYVEAVGAVVTAADARDHETTGHSFRVALYTVALGRALGVGDEELKAIEWGALLHDVGKMVVPDDILRKSGPLTANEWHIMKQHPSWGYEMLAEVSFLQDEALAIIYSHHEHWDGSGYPRGIAGAEIPLSARLFAVMDAYDAITSDRPYRRAKSHAWAMAEIQRVAGSQLDPQVVETLCQIPEIELRKLHDLCRSVHPGLRIPGALLDRLADPAVDIGKRLG
jgi:putative nucleotidyltransferase with HDIG domain